VLHGRFEFNGETHRLPDPIDWLHNPSTDVEWHILLHKFYYAAGLGQRWQPAATPAYAQRWAALLDGWMRQVPPGFIAADVTGRRVQNWIYSLHAFVARRRRTKRRWIRPSSAGCWCRCTSRSSSCAPPHAQAQPPHAGAVRHLPGRRGLPEMARAAHWRRFALDETLANMQADLLPDGVHCELSTDYHHLAVRNWLQVRSWPRANGVPVPAAMDAAAAGTRVQPARAPAHGVVPSLSDGDARSYLGLLAQGAALFGREDMRFVATQAPAARRRNVRGPALRGQRLPRRCAAAGARGRLTLRARSTWSSTAARWAKATTATSTA
jgi:hypothetical protein